MISEGLDALVCDLDGVIYRGDVPVPGSPEAVEALRGAGVRILFATNNSRSTPEEYVERLARVGVPARPSEILTSAMVTAEVLAARGCAGMRALVIGGRGVRRALAGVGIQAVDEPGTAELVVIGWDPGFDYEAMKRAALAVRTGARLVATNNDAAFPAPGGELWPGAGAILASVETASGVRADVMGKPHLPFMERAAAHLDGAARVALVGDRPETDLAGGAAMGWVTVLVLSGVTSAAEAETVRPRPDLVVADLAELSGLVTRQ